MPDQCYYPNAVRILEMESKLADKAYELLRDGCEKDQKQADMAKDKYDLGCELRHAAAVLRESKPSGVL